MRVRTYGLRGKPEYNDLVGRVKSEVDGGRWCIVLDKDGRELALKPENFTECECDVSDIDHLDSGAVVCKAHRLEVCGACGMDFRLLNSEKGVSVPVAEPLSISAKKLGAHDEGLQNLDPSRLSAILPRLSTRRSRGWKRCSHSKTNAQPSTKTLHFTFGKPISRLQPRLRAKSAG